MTKKDSNPQSTFYWKEDKHQLLKQKISMKFQVKIAIDEEIIEDEMKKSNQKM